MPKFNKQESLTEKTQILSWNSGFYCNWLTHIFGVSFHRIFWKFFVHKFDRFWAWWSQIALEISIKVGITVNCQNRYLNEGTIVFVIFNESQIPNFNLHHHLLFLVWYHCFDRLRVNRHESHQLPYFDSVSCL